MYLKFFIFLIICNFFLGCFFVFKFILRIGVCMIERDVFFGYLDMVSVIGI